jgi:HSP20 family protein
MNFPSIRNPSESDSEIFVSADIPGLDVKDFTITLESDHLVISGEKKMEKKEKDHTYTRIGRVYGSFRQHIPVNVNQIDENKIQAIYKDGVLQIKLQKRNKTTTNSRKIPIKSA